MKRLSSLLSMLVALCISWPFQGCSDETYYHLAVTAGSDGTITAPTTSPIAVKPGVATNITAEPATNYQFSNWTVAVGTGVSFGNANIASTTVTLTGGNATIRANFTLIPYRLTVSAGSGGTITEPPSSPIRVNYGVATNITATPSAGYSFVNWTVSTGTGVNIANVSSASTTVTLTEGDATIQANFTPTYQLTVSAIGGGTVLEPPSNTISVKSGFATTVTARPSDGYSFVNWTVLAGTGVNIANADSVRTTVTLTEGDATIQANFTPNSYQLTVTAGSGGTITVPPSSPITVTYGVATNITATPNSHYGFVMWTETTNTWLTFGDETLASTTVTLDGNGGDATIQANFCPLIITVAGNGSPGYSGDNEQATSAQLNYPDGIAVDSSGNIYIADHSNEVIRKVNTSGIITTFAGGGAYRHFGDNGPATSAYLSGPAGMAADSLGNIYFADQGNDRVRKVDTSGIITTLAGLNTQGHSGDGGPATSAELNNPSDVAVDSSGNIYIADYSNNCIRKIDTLGIITTVAGSENYGYSGDNGPATSAKLHFPNGVAVDSSGNIYIADTGNHVIRKVDTFGIITTVAGYSSIIYSGGYSGDGGPATSAGLNYPMGVAVDASGNIYFVDSGNDRIRKVDTSGIITTVAGNGNVGYSGDNGLATSAWFFGPTSVAVDSSDNIYIVDRANQRVRMVYGP